MKRAALSIILSSVIAINAMCVDAFVSDGQSNSVGQGNNEQVYPGTALLLTRANAVVTLVDPSGLNSGSIYSLYTGPAGGSPWISCATNLDAQFHSKQFAFVPCSVDGISILNCQPSGPNPSDRTNLTTYYGCLVWRTRLAVAQGWTVKCRIVIQGETDANNGMTQAAWNSNICYQADQYYADTGLPTMWCTIYGGAEAVTANENNINNGTLAAAGIHHILPFTADLSVIDVSATRPHAVNDSQLAQAGSIIESALNLNIYTAHMRYRIRK